MLADAAAEALAHAEWGAETLALDVYESLRDVHALGDDDRVPAATLGEVDTHALGEGVLPPIVAVTVLVNNSDADKETEALVVEDANGVAVVAFSPVVDVAHGDALRDAASDVLTLGEPLIESDVLGEVDERALRVVERDGSGDAVVDADAAPD